MASTAAATALRVLLVEDTDTDAELLIRALRRGHREVRCRRVQTPDEMRSALAEDPFDVVIADYSLPTFGAREALEILHESGHDLPFLIVSGTIGEETAVDALKAGAHDFLLKDRLARLLPAIERELREAVVRRERRDTLAMLKEAVRARDEFLSIASHELKTPLTSLDLQIANALKTLHREAGLGLADSLVPKLEVAARQVDRLTALIDNLLDVTRITSGRLPLTRIRVDLFELVRGMLTRLKETLARSASAVALKCEGPVVGAWDPLALESVIGNLLTNAAKFGEGRPIEISLEEAAGTARLIVRDHGIGIDADAQERIFQRFERAVSSRHYGGFGIGLWVTRQVVEAHGGQIAVTSEPGAGSTFTVSLPQDVSLLAGASSAAQPSAAR